MPHLIKENELLLLEEGDYSMFQYHGPFRAVRSFILEEAEVEFRKTWRGDERPSPQDFIAWLAKTHFIVDEPYRVFHFGFTDLDIS